MAKIPQEVAELFKDRAAAKLIATVGSDGMPNVAPKGSMAAIGEDMIAFADIVGGKTRANLDSNPKVAVAVMKEMTAYQVKGKLVEFQTSGPLFDNYVKMFEPMKMKPKAVGLIKVDEVYSLSPADAGKKLS